MRKANQNKIELKWKRDKYGAVSHSFLLNGKLIASIYPKETKDGRIHWGFWVDRINGNKEVNTDNCKICQIPSLDIKPTYPKRKDVKKIVEDVVQNMLGKECQ